jgi:hypothetical protein
MMNMFIDMIYTKLKLYLYILYFHSIGLENIGIVAEPSNWMAHPPLMHSCACEEAWRDEANVNRRA